MYKYTGAFASEMTYIVSGGALNSLTHSLTGSSSSHFETFVMIITDVAASAEKSHSLNSKRLAMKHVTREAKLVYNSTKINPAIRR